MAPPEVPAFDDVAAPAMSHLEIHQSIDLRMVQGAEVFTEGKRMARASLLPGWHTQTALHRGRLIS